jgi:hypothetical protein
MVVIDRDRIIDPHVLRGLANAIDVLLKCELRGVHADHHQSVIPILLGPSADIGKLAYPIDAGIGPEVDEDDFSAQVGCRQWLRVEPLGRAVKRRHFSQRGSSGMTCLRHERSLCLLARLFSRTPDHAELGGDNSHGCTAKEAAAIKGHVGVATRRRAVFLLPRTPSIETFTMWFASLFLTSPYSRESTRGAWQERCGELHRVPGEANAGSPVSEKTTSRNCLKSSPREVLAAYAPVHEHIPDRSLYRRLGMLGLPSASSEDRWSTQDPLPTCPAAHQDDTLQPGVALPFIRRLLSLNGSAADEQPVEVILLSRNDPDAGLRVFR